MAEEQLRRGAICPELTRRASPSQHSNWAGASFLSLQLIGARVKRGKTTTAQRVKTALRDFLLSRHVLPARSRVALIEPGSAEVWRDGRPSEPLCPRERGAVPLSRGDTPGLSVKSPEREGPCVPHAAHNTAKTCCFGQ